MAVIGLVSGGFAPGRERQVTNRRIEEAAQLTGQGEPGKLPEEIQERFLQHIQGEGVVAGKAGGQVGDPIAMAAIKDSKSLEVALVDQSDQVCVAARILCGVVQGNDDCLPLAGSPNL